MRNGLQEMKMILQRRLMPKMKFKFLVVSVAAALSAFIYPVFASATSILATAENFAVLAGTPNITNTGTTYITGDVGIHPAGAITGQGPGMDQIILNGAYHLADATALTAKNDLTTAYTALNNMPVTQTLLSNELGGTTLTSGVYTFLGNPATVLLNGILTLDAQGNNNAYWVLQIPNALTTGVGSSVIMTNFGSNGGSDNGLFWAVGSSASIFGSTSFEGNILALTSITIGNSATILNGRALARNGTVTMDTNTISIVCPPGGPGNGGPGYSGALMYDANGNIVPIGPWQSPVPEPASMLLVGSGLVGFIVFRKRFKKA